MEQNPFRLKDILRELEKASSLPDVAKKLEVEVAELIYFLLQHVEHPSGERWSKTAARALQNTTLLNPVFEPTSVLIEILTTTAKSEGLDEAKRATKLGTYLPSYLKEHLDHSSGEYWSDSARLKLIELGVVEWREITKRKQSWYEKVWDI